MQSEIMQAFLNRTTHKNKCYPMSNQYNPSHTFTRLNIMYGIALLTPFYTNRQSKSHPNRTGQSAPINLSLQIA